MKDGAAASVVLGGVGARHAESATPRSFGVVVGSFLALLSVLAAWKGRAVSRDLLLASLAVFLLAWKFSRSLTVPARVWMALGRAMHRVVSPLALGLIFFGIVTPLAAIRRMLRHDPLTLRWDPLVRSYWLEPERTSHDLKDQF